MLGISFFSCALGKSIGNRRNFIRNGAQLFGADLVWYHFVGGAVECSGLKFKRITDFSLSKAQLHSTWRFWVPVNLWGKAESAYVFIFIFTEQTLVLSGMIVLFRGWNTLLCHVWRSKVGLGLRSDHRLSGGNHPLGRYLCRINNFLPLNRFTFLTWNFIHFNGRLLSSNSVDSLITWVSFLNVVVFQVKGPDFIIVALFIIVFLIWVDIEIANPFVILFISLWLLV